MLLLLGLLCCIWALLVALACCLPKISRPAAEQALAVAEAVVSWIKGAAADPSAIGQVSGAAAKKQEDCHVSASEQDAPATLGIRPGDLDDSQVTFPAPPARAGRV